MSPTQPPSKCGFPLKNRLFMDGEFDGLRPERLVWDVGMVLYDQDGMRHQRSMLVEDIDLSEAEVQGITYADFRGRHPKAGGTPEPNTEVLPEAQVAQEVFRFAFNAVAAGVTVHFDHHAFDRMLRRHGYCMATWYNFVCVENRALAALQIRALDHPSVAAAHTDLLRQANQGRWQTDAIAAAFGVELPTVMRHTAIGDAILAEMIHLASVVDCVVPEPGVIWTPPPDVQLGIDAARRPQDDAARA